MPGEEHRSSARSSSNEKARMAFSYRKEGKPLEKPDSFCIRCDLCVRYCAEVKKKNAIGFVDTGK